MNNGGMQLLTGHPAELVDPLLFQIEQLCRAPASPGLLRRQRGVAGGEQRRFQERAEKGDSEGQAHEGDQQEQLNSFSRCAGPG